MSSSPNHYTPNRFVVHEWRRIPGHDGYLACSDGRIASVKRGHMRILTARPNNRGGYRLVKLSGRWFYVHRLVLSTFIGPAPQDHEADHLDFQTTRNTLDNLRWLPRSANRRRKRTTAHRFH